MKRTVIVGIALSLVVAGCGDDDQAAEWPAELPVETAELAAIFDPMLAPYGYSVSRGNRVERATYELSADGDHLAIYVEPDTYLTADEIAEDFPILIRMFLPHVFDRWPDLQSFDICQEPFESPLATGPSLTILDVTRDAAATVEWAGIDLSTVISLHERDGFSVFARPVVTNSGTWSGASEF